MTLPTAEPSVLPYSLVVGQEDLRRALELCYVSPGLGVLATGKRGTAKSTTVRAFSKMAYGRLPITLPIGATDDRVIGGWRVEELLQARSKWQEGLLEQVTGAATDILYIDEVNLLDDHLVNLILDAASTGVLEVQRDNLDRPTIPVRFSLVGTMNPDEGGLRPQLLDRFGLVVMVDNEDDVANRRLILESVLRYEDERAREERDHERSEYLVEAGDADGERLVNLDAARERLLGTTAADGVVDACARLAAAFGVVGHRGDLVMMRAARAEAAVEGVSVIERRHLRQVAKLALVHRRPNAESGSIRPWAEEDEALVDRVLFGQGDR